MDNNEGQKRLSSLPNINFRTIRYDYAVILSQIVKLFRLGIKVFGKSFLISRNIKYYGQCSGSAIVIVEIVSVGMKTCSNGSESMVAEDQH